MLTNCRDLGYLYKVQIISKEENAVRLYRPLTNDVTVFLVVDLFTFRPLNSFFSVRRDSKNTEIFYPDDTNLSQSLMFRSTFKQGIDKVVKELYRDISGEYELSPIARKDEEYKILVDGYPDVQDVKVSDIYELGKDLAAYRFKGADVCYT